MAELKELHPGLSMKEAEYRSETLPLGDDLGVIPERLWIPTRTPGYDRLARWSLSKTSPHESMQKVYVALESIAATLIESAPNYMLQVNRYHPGSNGRWHADFSGMLPIFIVGLTDIEEPSFEYARQIVRGDDDKLIPGDDTAEVVVKSGDLLKQETPDFMHRGLNPTDDFRYSGVVPSWGIPLLK
jgi:hypothetical protein